MIHLTYNYSLDKDKEQFDLHGLLFDTKDSTIQNILLCGKVGTFAYSTLPIFCSFLDGHDYIEEFHVQYIGTFFIAH